MSYVCDESVEYYEGIYNGLGDCIHKNDGAKLAGFVFGWCSIGCWLFAQLPQFVRTCKLKDAENVSVYMFPIWMVGDLANLIGVILTKGLVTQLASAIYYTFIDAACAIQNLYFNCRGKGKAVPTEGENVDVNVSVEGEVDGSSSSSSGSSSSSSSSTSSSSGSASTSSSPSSSEAGEENSSEAKAGVSEHSHSHRSVNAAEAAMVAVGLASSSMELLVKNSTSNSSPCNGLLSLLDDEMCYNAEPNFEKDDDYKSSPAYIAGEVLGYVSGVLYLACRLPQIIQNAKRHRVFGLAPGLFCLAICGNSFYVLSVCLSQRSKDEWISQIPWLLGSAGTLFLDILVLIQYRIYRSQEKREAKAAEAQKDVEEEDEYSSSNSDSSTSSSTSSESS